MGALPTRWRRKTAGVEITSLSLYVYTHARALTVPTHKTINPSATSRAAQVLE